MVGLPLEATREFAAFWKYGGEVEAEAGVGGGIGGLGMSQEA
jgi:hypothetical protein